MGLRVFAGGGSASKGCVWFRVLGLGLMVKSPSTRPGFGEQHGLRRPLALLGWRVWLLLPMPRALPNPRAPA